MKITREQSFQFRPRARIEGVLRLKPAAWPTQALELLNCEKRLEIIPGATQFFEEPTRPGD